MPCRSLALFGAEVRGAILMIAIIKDRGETYVSPVFAVKGAGWKSEILAFDRDRTRIQRIDMWKRQPHLSRQVFIVKEEAFGCQRMKWTGYGRVLDDKEERTSRSNSILRGNAILSSDFTA